MAIQDHMGSFIVRMYGDDGADGKAFVGIAQDVEGGGSFPFKGPEDLWSILTAGHPEARPGAGDDKDGPATTQPVVQRGTGDA